VNPISAAMTRASLLLSMLLVALLGQPAFEPAAATAGAPARPTVEIGLAEALRGLPVSASANDSVVPDDGSAGGSPPLLPTCVDCLATPLPAQATFASLSSAEPAERRPAANRARAPPAA
jgi:hypothetical protein